MNNLAERVTEYETLLRDISPYVDKRIADRILATLDKVSKWTPSFIISEYTFFSHDRPSSLGTNVGIVCCQ